jgi:hypothetical protein
VDGRIVGGQFLEQGEVMVLFLFNDCHGASPDEAGGGLLATGPLDLRLSVIDRPATSPCGSSRFSERLTRGGQIEWGWPRLRLRGEVRPKRRDSLRRTSSLSWFRL